jgi:uncharacterized membrane protein YebE (DUF533 family)
MTNRTQQRPSTGTSRFSRLTGAGRTDRPSSSVGSGRFARTSAASSPSGARFGRPTPARKKKSSGSRGLAGLASALLSGSKKKSSGGAIGKSAGGLAALAGLAGLAVKNRSKIRRRPGLASTAGNQPDNL